MKFKYLICGILGCMISCAAMSATSGGDLDRYKGCCEKDQMKCNTDEDCTQGGYSRGKCGVCTGAVVDPDPLDPSEQCIPPKVMDDVSGVCVCPQMKGELAIEPACGNGTFNSTTCECDCDAGYYQDGDTCKPCPPNGTSEANALAITECYANNFEDDTGSGNYTDECYYSE